MALSSLRIALTGASGFIGSRLVERLLTEGVDGKHADVLAVASSTAGAEAIAALHPAVEVLVLPEALDELPQRLRGFDAFVHAGWSTVPAEAERDPIKDLRVNVEGSIRLFQTAIGAGVGRLIFISSGGTVYGEPQALPIVESHPIAPHSAYGSSKACAEGYLLAMTRATPTQGLVLRPANVYGRDHVHDKPQGVVEHWLARLQRGETLTCWNDTGVVRDYVHVNDMVSALVAALHRPITRSVLNVGTGIGTSLSELATAMARVTGREARLVPGTSLYPAIMANVLDITRMRECLGVAPSITLEEGLRLTWKAIQQQA